MRPSRLSSIAAGIVAATLVVAPQGPAVADATTGPGDPFPGFVQLQGDQEPGVDGSGTIRAVAVQSDGKIVFAQHGNAGTSLRRLHPDGTPDPSWGILGSVALEGGDWVNQLLVLPGDRVVAMEDRVLRRFTANGAPDTTFSGDGAAPLPVETDYVVSYAKALTRDADGGLVVVGETFYTLSDWDVFATRFHADGSADLGFRNGRSAYYSSVDGLADNRVYGALAGPGGTQHLIGRSGAPTDPAAPTVWELHPDAALDPDPTFLPLPTGTLSALIPGETSGTGYLSGTSGGEAFLAKLRVDEGGVVLDPTWGTNGVVTGDESTVATTGALQPDGKLVLATYGGLVRRHPDGTIDPSFDPTDPTLPRDAFAYDAAVTSDGALVVAGTAAVAGTTTSQPFLSKHVGVMAGTGTSVSYGAVPGLAQTATVTYRNDGPDPAEDARVVVETPPGMTPVLSASRGTCTGGGAVWTCIAGTLPPRSEVTVSVTLTSSTSTTGTLTATGSSTTYDPHVTDQSGSVTITSTALPTTTTPSTPSTTTPPTTSPPTTSPTAASITLVSSPVVTGRARVGNRLRATTGTWSPTPTGYRYRWLRNGRAITKATGRTYVLTPKDLGTRISVRVTASRSGHTTARATSRVVRVKDRDRSATRSRPVVRSLSS
jgi:uncharacterized delta-60 repeat protein